MTDAIAPVLTPDEWRNKGMDDPSVLGELPYIAEADPRAMAKVMAKANSLLDEGSEYKITHADVTMLRELAHALRFDWHGSGDEELDALAAKLAALLPPE